jgi:hypothetical protein
MVSSTNLLPNQARFAKTVASPAPGTRAAKSVEMTKLTKPRGPFMYPRPDCSTVVRNFSPTPENELIDLGWQEGIS